MSVPGGVCYQGGVCSHGGFLLLGVSAPGTVSAAGGVCSQGGVCSWEGVCCGGCLFSKGLSWGGEVWPSVMAFWFGGLLIEGGLLVEVAF